MSAKFLFFILLCAAVSSAAAQGYPAPPGPPRTPATGPCPLKLLSGDGSSGAISVTFMNVAKQPIRRLQFTCKPPGATAKSKSLNCGEPSAIFFPQVEQTVTLDYTSKRGSSVLVSVQGVTFGDGTKWKPSKRGSCRVLKVQALRDVKK